MMKEKLSLSIIDCFYEKPWKTLHRSLMYYIDENNLPITQN